MFSGRKFDVQACGRHALAPTGALVLTLVLGAIGAGWAQAAAVGSAHAAAHRSGSLSIVVAYLPSGIRATAMLHGPAGTRSLARTTRLRRAPAGNYTLAARPVNAGNRTYYPTVARCGVVAECPSLPHGRASLKPGAHLTLYVAYYDVVSAETHVLVPVVLRRLRGGPGANGKLIFAGTASLGFSRGSIIVSAPSGVLPDGIFAKVSRVTVAHGQAVVATAPASLVEAVPRGAVHFTAISAAQAASSTPKAHAADTLSFSFPGTPLSCGAGHSVTVAASASLDKPDWTFSPTWDGSSPPTLSVSGTLGGTFSTSITTTGGGCDLSRDFPASDSAEPGWVGPMFEGLAGPVPLWWTPEMVGTVKLSVSADTAIEESTTEHLGVTAGISYDSSGFHTIFTRTHTVVYQTGTPVESGTVSAAAGGKLYFDLMNQRLVACKFLRNCDDTLGVPYVALTGGPTLKAQPTLQPWWRVDATLGFTAGFVIPKLHLDASRDFELPWSYPLFAPPGTPRALTATPENEAAKVSWQPPPPNPADPPMDDEVPCACQSVTGYNVYENGVLAASTVGTSVRLPGLTNGTTYQITARANSAEDYAYSQETAPVAVTPTIQPALAITTASFSNAQTGVPYTTTLQASGGIPPYTWSVSSGSLPAGLTLNGSTGVISGTPTTPGTSSIPITVTDSLGDQQTKSYTLDITVAPAIATSVSTGGISTCAVLSTGSVDCWGGNEEGQLGDGTTTEPDSCYNHNSCSTTPVAVSTISDATSVSTSGSDACAVLSTGAVECWGGNEEGQLGDGTSTGPDTCDGGSYCSATPVAVSGISDATSVSTGGISTCAVLSTGGVDCWGDGEEGLLGDGTEAGSTTPVAVSGISDATSVSTGADFACAVLATGGVDCWGSNQFGELGGDTSSDPERCFNGDPCSTTPVAVRGISDATSMSGEVDSACAVLSTGGVDCWGDNSAGTLGDGTTTGSDTCPEGPPWPCSPTPVAVSAINDATSVSSGGDACALLTTGGVDCWGETGAGGLGDGTTTGPDTCFNGGSCSPTPVAVSAISNATSVSAGGGHACALLSTGAVDCWGDNSAGTLGDGSTETYSDIPVPVTGIP
jgi:alpha-tubulin suppressor-like RCC1 family protein